MRALTHVMMIATMPRLAVAVIAGALVIAGMTSGRALAAGDAKAGRAKAQMCQACHGVDGLSKVPDAPNLAGQIEGYLVAQLKAFKSGERKNEAMTLVASSLSDADIDNLAAWYASIEVKVGKLPGD
jgi:cytochrome c553